MITEVRYRGYTAKPSDQICQDGELELSMGLIPEDGTMKPIMEPKKVDAIGDDENLKYIHKANGYENIIVLKDNNTIYYYNSENKKKIGSFENDTQVYQITAIGNTLIVLTSEGMHYYLFKDKGYKHLGSQLPDNCLTFGLQGEVKVTEQFRIHFDEIAKSNIYNELTNENKIKISEQVLAKVNKYIAEHSTNKGKFIFPFLLRYAYRLYDGTLTMHSAPILMIASSDITPQVICTNLGGGNNYTYADLAIAGLLNTIDYAAINQIRIDELKEWEDIIRSVDVFVSKPIYTYDQNGLCTSFVNYQDTETYSVCKLINQQASINEYPKQYQKSKFIDLYALATTYGADSDDTRKRLLIPKRGADSVKSDIKNCSQFYFLESLKLEQIKTERQKIVIKDDYLQSLIVREVMTDDYDSHDKIIPQYAFPYNSRLNIANIRKELYRGYEPETMFNYTDGDTSQQREGASPTEDGFKEDVEIFVCIKQGGKDIAVSCGRSKIGWDAPLLFFYYPNINAYKIVVKRVGRIKIEGRIQISTYDYELPLEQHAFLNGAFYFGGWEAKEDIKEDNIIPTISTKEERTIDITNKVYTSEVNNPFFFPLSGINTIGTGKILGISSAVKALSQGQFGQFPLYAFSTEGVWALELSQNGTYRAKQPVTRDICINPKTITQIDNAVLFATDRGIMLISGANTECITETITNEKNISIEYELPHAHSLINLYNEGVEEKDWIRVRDINIKPFKEFAKDCKMIYDYTNQRIVLYNKAEKYAYVFSLKSRAWGMMKSNIIDNINSYPEALAVTKGEYGKFIIDLSQTDAENENVFLMTRPIKLEIPNDLKTISKVVQRGYFKRKKIKCILYASKDLHQWHHVWSSKTHKMTNFSGTPYRYYKLAVISNLRKEDNISSVTIEYRPKLTNKIR